MAIKRGTKMGESLRGTNSTDSLYGRGGDDKLYGLAGADSLFGGVGNDALFGGTGRDLLDGGNGNDLLDGGKGYDRMFGGLGDDIYIVNSIGDQVAENTGSGIDRVQSSVSWTLGENVENLTLTGSAAINGTGNGLANVLIGNGSANSLDGGSGDDTVSYAGVSEFTVNNAINYGLVNLAAGQKFGIAVEIGGGNNFSGNVAGAVAGTAGMSSGDTFTSIEIVVGTAFTDIIDLHSTGTVHGGSGNDNIQLFAGGTANGGSGNDGFGLINGGTANGDSGNDSIFLVRGGTGTGGDGEDYIINQSSIAGNIVGDAGNDTLVGGGGIDSIFGGSGNDHIRGGLGIDSLSGGVGADTFFFSRGDSGDFFSPVSDLISDFSRSQGDRIDLRAFFGGEAVAFAGSGGITTVGGGNPLNPTVSWETQIAYSYDTTSNITRIYYTNSGSSSALFAIIPYETVEVAGFFNLTMADFIV